MTTKLVSPGTQKIVSHDYLYCTLYENLSEGTQRLIEGAFWLILKDGKESLVPITKTTHQSKTCYVCSAMDGTFTSPQALAKSYDEMTGNQLMTFKTVKIE